MRAKEFITEATVGKLHPEQQSTMPRAHKFAGTADRTYDLNRAMMAVASSDGETLTHPVDEESWIGRNNMAAPYTEIEHKMLHHAYASIGCDISDASPTHSQEPDTVHRISPVAKKPRDYRKG